MTSLGVSPERHEALVAATGGRHHRHGRSISEAVAAKCPPYEKDRCRICRVSNGRSVTGAPFNSNAHERCAKASDTTTGRRSPIRTHQSTDFRCDSSPVDRQWSMPHPARPIVTRCRLCRPDARQARTRRASPAGMREKHRRTGFRGPSVLDRRATRTTLEYGSRSPVRPPFRARAFRSADRRKTR